MPLLRPIRHRSPMVTTRSLKHRCPGTIPADSVTPGPITVWLPMWMYRSFIKVSCGKQMALCAPNDPNRRARRLLGPIVASRDASDHANWITSPARRSIIPRARCHADDGSAGRSSTTADTTVGRMSPLLSADHGERPRRHRAHDESVTATTPLGAMSGTRHGDTLVFKGIPYATAPRFAPPVPVAPWAGTLDATHYRAQCPQLPSALERLLGGSSLDQDEQCLHLNVFTPGCDGGRRPVLVWIHGGAFLTGGGAMPWFHGAALVELGDVVVVTCNYRLGALGFTGRDNLGIADQVSALTWVAHNIEAFGGDPGRVTVFGESAGGASVVSLLGTPAADHLFRAAWAMSPSIPQIRTADRAAEAERQLIAAAGVPDRAALAGLDVEALLAAQATLIADRASSLTAFSPAHGGALFHDDIVDAAARDERPFVIGTTRDEMRLFTAFDPDLADLDEKRLTLAASRRFADATRHAVATYRAARPDASPSQVLSAIQTDEMFRVPARRLADARSVGGRPTWAYWFTWATPAFGGVLGSAHGLDIPFAFHNLDRPGVEMFTGDDPARRAVADEFAGALVRFAHGDLDSGPGWNQYDTERRATRRIDVESLTIEDPEAELLSLWERR